MTARQHIDSAGFAELIRAGHARLKQMVNAVNALNVFPVPDGDTGTNMEMSLSSGVAQLANASGKRLADVTQAFASGLLMGARGNSGVILSQLFRGFAKVTQHVDRLDVQTFAKALQEGVNIAYRAVAKPVEGTILTVARESAAVGMMAAKRAETLQDWMEAVYDAAVRALEHTPELLPVLKQAGVVDSGGQGLVYIYEGFLKWLRGESLVEESATEKASPDVFDFAAAHIDHDGEYGYCTEVLIRLEDTDSVRVQEQLRETLGRYGDSLLVVGTDSLVKVHVHTLHPGRVLEDALEFGPLVKIKIDNMTEQHSSIQQAADPQQRPAPSSRKDADKSAGANKPVAVVAVAAGEGLSEVFRSLGADVVLSGGQTMNPSTEEIVDAVRSAGGEHVMVLPNNKNIVLAAKQAAEILGQGVTIVPTTTIPEGIAAMMAYLPDQSAEDNANRMTAALEQVHSGQVVRAVRDSVYQDREIRENQYLGLDNQTLVYVGDSRKEAVLAVVDAMGVEGAELLTVFYGDAVPQSELDELVREIETRYGLEVEMKFGGQPVYDYIFSLE
jgi:DAK2 domain fusion protein YloV